jgi:hypothetical protein
MIRNPKSGEPELFARWFSDHAVGVGPESNTIRKSVEAILDG